MNVEGIHDSAGQDAARRYRNYGLFGGVALGLFAGVLISGLHFDEWPAGASLALVLACGAGGALVGRLFLGIATGSLPGGGAWGTGHGEGGDVSGTGDHGSGGGHDGDA
jgi:hypothetical protein